MQRRPCKRGTTNEDIKVDGKNKGQDSIKRRGSNMSCLCFDFTSPGDSDAYIKNNETCFRTSNSDVSFRKKIDRSEDPDGILNPRDSHNVANFKFYSAASPIEAMYSTSESARLIETESNEKSSRAPVDISDQQGRADQDGKIIGNEFANPAMENDIEILKNETQDKSLKKPGAEDDLIKLEISGDKIDGFKNKSHHSGFVHKIPAKVEPYQQNISTQFPDNIRLFECLLLIGLNLDDCENKVPYIKMKYPANACVPHCIEHLCFPDAHRWSEKIEIDDPKSSNRFYTITVTTECGQRKYVYCIRVKPEGESALLPLSYCLLSSRKANEFYFKFSDVSVISQFFLNPIVIFPSPKKQKMTQVGVRLDFEHPIENIRLVKILEEVEARHGEMEEEFFIFVGKLLENRFPILGAGILVQSSEKEPGSGISTKPNMLVIKRSADSNLARALEYMKIDVFMSIFSNMLLERKIILLSSSISKLSSCIEGLQTALLPFEWQHALITVVPSAMISINDLCEAPTPYLIGLLKPSDNIEILPNMKNIQRVIVVDIDEQKILKKIGDEQSILPRHFIKVLKNSLKLTHTFETEIKNVLACEAFARLFVRLLSNYRRHIIRDDLDQRLKIHKEAFVSSTKTRSIRIFLEQFVETAAFSAFVETHWYSTESKELFKKHLLKYEYEVKPAHVKNNNTSKIFGIQTDKPIKKSVAFYNRQFRIQMASEIDSNLTVGNYE